MKVLELLESELENEWENAPVEINRHLRHLLQKQSSLIHRGQIIRDKLAQTWPDEEAFGPWQIDHLDLSSFPRAMRPYIEKLKKIASESNKLQKELVAAKTNMKYARHDPYYALHHAKYVRKGRYPEGEDAIASNPKIAYEYAVHILNQRFLKGEPTIYSDPELRHRYKIKFGTINKTWTPNEV